MQNSQAHSTLSIPQLEDPKNSRILNRKQIQKRLQNLKPGEYDRICNNLTSQNKRLKEEVKQLHQKIEQLMIAKKIPDLNSHKNPLIEQEIKKMKKQLNLKYQSMNYLKEQLSAFKTTQSTEQIKNQIRNNLNEINNIDRQMKQLSKDKEQIEKTYDANMEQYEEYHPKKQQNYQDRLKKIRDENKELRKKIFAHSSADKAHQKNSQQIIDKMYTLKQEQQRYMKVLMENKNSKKKLTVNDVKTIDVGHISSLQREIEMLKVQKKDAEKELVNQKILKDQKKAKIEKQVRQLMDEHKELLRRRQKALNHLNLYQAKDKKQKQFIVEKEQKAKVETEEKSCQTDKIIPKDFRKEWIGKSEGISFDDSLNLQFRSQIYIKGAMIYKNTQQICCIRFLYESIHKKRYESKLPLQSSILRKYENKKHSAKSGSYLQSFIISLTQDKITRIQLIWSDGEKSAEGYQIDSSTRYIADIGAQERPISMFGTISYQGKNNYALESLGCEINSVDQQ